MSNWTFGAEHEFADWDIRTPLPEGFGRDLKDYTIVNSNGIANDPSGKLYSFGGEINTPPTNTPQGQAEILSYLKALLPEAKINYRSNLHIHVRVPGLRDNLELLKRVQRFIHTNMPRLFPLIQPMPRPATDPSQDPLVVRGAQRRWRRMRVSHQTLLTSARLERQLAAQTIDEFFRLEPPHSKTGQPLWVCQPRLCVNLRQLLETDTVEFRHFAGTMNEREMFVATCWCEEFLQCAIEGELTVEDLEHKYETGWFPKFEPYNHRLEHRYRATVNDGSLPKRTVQRNIASILAGTFRDYDYVN